MESLTALMSCFVSIGSERDEGDGMKWAKTPPTEPGWYWWKKQGGSKSIILLADIPMRVYAMLFSDEWRTIDEIPEGEWWPEKIEPPENS